jgi:hypothetical protein
VETLLAEYASRCDGIEITPVPTRIENLLIFGRAKPTAPTRIVVTLMHDPYNVRIDLTKELNVIDVQPNRNVEGDCHDGLDPRLKILVLRDPFRVLLNLSGVQLNFLGTTRLFTNNKVLP